MLISASRRTDLPAFYSDWLYNRIREEYVLVRNPINKKQISRVSLSPDVVDGIVFWTKNPAPMMDRLDELEKYIYYFQFTLTAYDRDVEQNLPSKKDVIIPAFQQLSKRIGRERVIWRYDPILFNERYTIEYHCRLFRTLASRIGEYTEKCTISFLDLYKNTERNIQPLCVQPDTDLMQREIMERFSDISKEFGFYIDTCAEKTDSICAGIPHACCVDKERFERIGKCRLDIGKDPNQRPECGCAASIDIGAYNTCRNGCLYCYANFNQDVVLRNSKEHNPASPLLFGNVDADDIVKERAMKSCRVNQLSLFDAENQD